MRKKTDAIISIIIPAYNSGEKLKRAVESIVCSEMKEVEIIIVENGSTDNTLQIAYKLQEQYPSIMVCQSCKGVSFARNMGIEKAMGKWLCFMDADDLMCKGAVSEYINTVKKYKADLYFFSYKKNNRYIKIDETKKSKEQYICMILENPTRFSAVWGKLYRTEIIKRKNIRFDTDLSLSEDSVFLLKYLSEIEKIKVCDACVYEYQIDGASATRGYSGTKEREYIKSLKKAESVVDRKNENIKNSFKIYTAMQLNLIMVKDIFVLKNGLSFGDKIRKMKNVSERNEMRKAISDIKIRECCSVRMMPIGFIKIHFYGAAAVIYTVRTIMNYLNGSVYKK